MLIKNKVLYFPYIKVPNSLWFTRMLLYWDEVGAIVPASFTKHPEKLGEHMRSLVQEGLVTQIIPSYYMKSLPSFRDSFLSYLSSLRPEIKEKRREAFKRENYFSIHIEKTHGLELEFERMGLAKSAKYPWWFVECDTADEFMLYLAGTLGNLKELEYAPISDSIQYLNRLISLSGPEIFNHGDISQLRLEILESIFPVPTRLLKVSEISNFKIKHGSKLKALRLRVEKEIIDIANINDISLRERRLEIFKEESRGAIQEIIAVMNESGFRNITLNSWAAIIISLSKDIPILGSLAKAIWDAYKKEDFSGIDPAYLYAAYAQKMLECPQR